LRKALRSRCNGFDLGDVSADTVHLPIADNELPSRHFPSSVALQRRSLAALEGASGPP
jgi:hypothetical protein